MKFGLQIPAGREGLYMPTGFSRPDQLIDLFRLAEDLGFYSVWGNDHLNTPRGARYRYDQLPNVYDILITLACAATATKRIKLGIAALTLPLREPVALAKQLTTLDIFSHGRMLIAVGIGHYRDEFTEVKPRERHSHRGEMFEEALEALGLIFTQEEVSFAGKYYEFNNISLNPKPVQNPLPIYITGTGPKTPERVLKWGTGWLMTTMEGQTLGERVGMVRRLAEAEGRDISEFDMAHTLAIRVDLDHQKAVDRFQNSLLMNSPRGLGGTSYLFTKCVGTPSEVAEQIQRVSEEGITHFVLQDFAVDSVEEMQEQVQLFGEEVIPLFASPVSS